MIGNPEDLVEYRDLIQILERKAGRIIFNGFPTGVEVSHAMVHGGPYPSTSDSRFTSVGSMAILRFARPVCYQGLPESALPEELRDANPLGIQRMVNGKIHDRPNRCKEVTERVGSVLLPRNEAPHCFACAITGVSSAVPSLPLRGRMRKYTGTPMATMATPGQVVVGL